MMSSLSPQHQACTQLLQSSIAPRAAQLDTDPKALKEAFYLLGKHHLLGLRVPETWGGQNWTAQAVYEFIEQLARYSGALAFLQIQHQSAIRELATTTNQALRHKYLEAAATGQIGLGIGYSHLRRPQQPITVEPTAEGYVFNGTVPWITGFGIFHHWLLGAQLPDGRAVFALAPFRPVVGADSSLWFSDPMQLASMESTQTVTATLDNWLVPQDLVVDVKPAGWIHQKDRANPLTHSFFPLGCARAGLDILEQSQSQNSAAIRETYQVLNSELLQCRTRIYQAVNEEGNADKLPLRAWAIDLAVRCAHAAVIVSRGAANLSTHPAQRVFRESLAFSVFGQTSDVMQASLSRLCQSSSS
jgi:alkylation response protein AidB-like acyl-CoA dehydrogenase